MLGATFLSVYPYEGALPFPFTSSQPSAFIPFHYVFRHVGRDQQRGADFYNAPEVLGNLRSRFYWCLMCIFIQIHCWSLTIYMTSPPEDRHVMISQDMENFWRRTYVTGYIYVKCLNAWHLSHVTNAGRAVFNSYIHSLRLQNVNNIVNALLFFCYTDLNDLQTPAVWAEEMGLEMSDAQASLGAMLSYGSPVEDVMVVLGFHIPRSAYGTRYQPWLLRSGLEFNSALRILASIPSSESLFFIPFNENQQPGMDALPINQLGFGLHAQPDPQYAEAEPLVEAGGHFLLFQDPPLVGRGVPPQRPILLSVEASSILYFHFDALPRSFRGNCGLRY